MNVLVTGATGYVGGRLIPRLLERGHLVRVLVRDPRRIGGRSWAEQVEVVTGDLLDAASVARAVAGVDAAYYLVHSMGANEDFASVDRRAAAIFGNAARNLAHVIYLGGLLPATSHVSMHLRSRAEVGAILHAWCHTTEFRAGPIIGSGSASFEMVRYLTERLPIMVAPRWILNDVQPIAIRDVLSYLLAALDHKPLGIVDIGVEPLTFREMMLGYAAVRNLQRIILPLPVPFPMAVAGASWVGLVTPIPNDLAIPLVEGVVDPIVGDTRRARQEFPEITPIPYRRAVELAIKRIERGDVETRWSGALGGAVTYEMKEAEGMVREVRSIYTELPAHALFKSFSSIGGERGWLAWEWAWEIRGAMDKVAGGPGLRRSRRDPIELLPGEALDFWRVEVVEPPHLLRLRAEMKVPGHAWLQWETVPEGSGTRLVQTALFAPTGLWGMLYWYSLYPVHKVIFSDLINAVARDAVYMDDRRSTAPATLS
jgi:uncharacterized protein YbjT (DUF2867 family)